MYPDGPMNRYARYVIPSAGVVITDLRNRADEIAGITSASDVKNSEKDR